MQLATNNRRGFMRSVSGAKKFATAREESWYNNEIGSRQADGDPHGLRCRLPANQRLIVLTERPPLCQGAVARNSISDGG